MLWCEDLSVLTVWVLSPELWGMRYVCREEMGVGDGDGSDVRERNSLAGHYLNQRS